jgi:hypothetical protein
MLRLAPLLVLLLAAACGGSVSSVPAAEAEGGAPPEGGGPVGCSGLSVGALHVVSDQPASSSRLTTVAAAASGGLVGWLSTAPGAQAPIPLRVRAVDRDGAPVSGAHDVLSLLGGGGSVAWGYGRVGAIGADSSLVCQLVQLDPGGAPLAASTAVAMGACGQLGTTATGFDLLATSSGTISLVSTNSSGQPAGSVILETDAAPATVVRATFADQSFLLAWTSDVLSNCECPQPLTVQHFAADGQPLSPKSSPARVYPGARFALTAEGDRALLITPGSPAGPVAVRALDMAGNVVGGPLALGGGAAGQVSSLGLDVAGIGGDVAIAAWIETSGTTQAHVVAQAITTAPAVLSQPVVVAPSGIGVDVKVVGNAARALVVWDGPLAGTPSQVTAAALGCAP